MSSCGPSTYHTARHTIQGCDCMSTQQLSRNNFSMLLPTFFHFLGHHFWVPFLGPIFGAPYHFKRKFYWSSFKNGPPFLGPKNWIIFDFFFAKTRFFMGLESGPPTGPLPYMYQRTTEPTSRQWSSTKSSSKKLSSGWNTQGFITRESQISEVEI